MGKKNKIFDDYNSRNEGAEDDGFVLFDKTSKPPKEQLPAIYDVPIEDDAAKVGNSVISDRHESRAVKPANLLGISTPLIPPKDAPQRANKVSDAHGNDNEVDDYLPSPKHPKELSKKELIGTLYEFDDSPDHLLTDDKNSSLAPCENCELRYRCELVAEDRLLRKNYPDGNLPAYATADQESCIMGDVRKGFKTKLCNEKYVADGIGNDHKIELYRKNGKYHIDTEAGVDKWRPEVPVFISAQTGRGKNHFIENVLLEYVRELNIRNGSNQKVLIVSNRIALKEQIAKRIKPGTTDQEIEDETIYGYNGYDCAVVKMYQGLLNFVELLKRKKEVNIYSFVIFDEAHFFTSDAMFNPDTAKILTAITNTFKNAIRLYMSATPYDCIRYIDKYECEAQQLHGSLFYHFKRNYDYIDVKDFSHIGELKDTIVESVGRGEKWLIFIDSKTECQNVKKC